ncbi:MAG: mismatch repair protein MutS [Myxococcales bacterium]|nr:mismatch repair protein MutS [Myxococcales bacterium]
MRQYLDVKARYPDAIVFFRLGDFYEMFYEDAVYVARALDLTLTSRDKGKEDPVPMCGIPHHAARGYLAKLMELGHRVALCEQLEDPKLARGIVRRDVVRVVTPGVILDEEALDPRAPQFVAAVLGEPRQGYGLAFLDVTTGDFRATEASTLEALLDELARAEPRELVVGRGAGDLAAALRRGYPRVPQTNVADDDIAGASAVNPGAELAQRAPQAVAAAARVLRYARSTQPGITLALGRLDFFRRTDTLILDEQARAHLELTETILERKRSGSLLEVLDETRSAMGGRLLRRWLLFPLVDVAAIRRRQDGVERLVLAHAARDAARQVLSDMADLERLVGRARLGVASPRDLVALGRSLALLPALGETLRAAARAEFPVATGAGPDDDLLSLGDDLAPDLAASLAVTLRPDAPALTKDGGYIAAGISAELDELSAIASGGRETVTRIEARERERTGISNLKIRHNSVFGYYIEISRSQLPHVPADYVRKQTVANAERFVTPELGEYEQKILSADERRITIELEIFTRLRDGIAAAADRLLTLAARVAAVDALACLAEVAHRGGYCRPLVDDSGIIDIADGRHPVVERLAAAGAFVPNDVRLDPDNEQILIVTGPNMAGKSTLIRQVALTVILSQMGSFVPARAARIGICDRVFTRVGAGDNLARGESTFLVEMRETAHILRYATARSLIILDEIGRGTSTYDGVSIAWAVAEHLHDRVRAKTLFATHYHELCALGDLHPRVRNVSVAAREWKGEVVFLRKLSPGGASRSFGIQVAKLAGLPAVVVDRARAILQTLEGDGGTAAAGLPRSAAPGGNESPQLGLFGGAPADSPAPVDETAAEVLAALRALDPDDLTPRAALDLVAAWRKKLTTPS